MENSLKKTRTKSCLGKAKPLNSEPGKTPQEVSPGVLRVRPLQRRDSDNERIEERAGSHTCAKG